MREVFLLCKEFGVSKFKAPNWEAEFGNSPAQTHVAHISLDSNHPMKNPLDNPMTEEEVLFWSAGGSERRDTNDKEVPIPLVGEELKQDDQNE